MAPSYFRKLISRAKSKRKVWDYRSVWIRPRLEQLDARILPSVTATLNNGILSIVATNDAGTTQVEIIHDQNQVKVEDTNQQVGDPFDISQINQIQFQYNQFALNLPVGQNQITLTGLPVGEADLNLGDSSLTAGINATLPDGTTAISLAGSVMSDGSYDLMGKADVTVDGFALQGAAFDVTNSSVAVAATATVGSDSVSLAGALDSQGNYDLKGNADVTVDGFTLPSTSFELTNASLAAAATLPLGGDNVSLAGMVGSDGSYDLTGTSDSITIGGFALTGASVELTNSSLTAGATLTLGSDSVTLNGSMDSSGNYDLTGTADITIAGFALPSTSFELTNAPANGVSVSATLPLGSDSVTLSGTVDNQGNYDLTGTSDSITIGGFALTGASVELTNTTLTVGATLTLGSDSVTLNGSMDSSGNYDLTGTADITIAGFALPSTSFELTNAPANGVKVSATLPLGSDTISLSGLVMSDGTYDLTGTADITVGGFALSGASFELTNTSLTVSATLALGSDSVSLSGTVDNQGNYDLTGTADITVGGFALPGASFELTNTSLTVSATLTLGSSSINLSGTVDNQGNYDLTGTADINVGLFALPGASFELTNTSLTVSATLTLGSNSIGLSGTVDNQGNYDLMGTADITVGGFSLPNVSFELTNTSLTASVTLSLGSIATVNLTGSVDTQGNYDLTGTGTITVDGFNLNASFELTNTSITVSATLALGSIATINLTGTVINNGGQYSLSSLTGTGTITVDGFNLNASFTLTSTNITVSATLALGSVATVNLTGTVVNNGGQYSLSNLTGTAAITVDGFNLNADFTLTSNSIIVHTMLVLGSIATIDLTGTVNKNGSNYTLSDLTGTGTITVDGFNLNASFTLTSSSVTVTATLALGSVATVSLTGTVNKNGSNYSLSNLTGTAAITVDGFNLNGSFTLTSSSIMVTATLALGSIATVSLSGTVNKNGSNYSLSDLTGTAAITVDGFNLNGSFTLTSSSVMVTATLALGSVATVSLTGTVNKNGSNYSLSNLTGTAAITVDGFNLNGSFTLTSSSIMVTATLALGSVATVSLTGTVNKNGSNYTLSDLSGTAAITVDGFNLNGSFTLTSSSVMVTATLALGSIATVSLTGTVNKNGSNYSLSDLSGTAAITVDGFNLNGSFTLTSSSVMVTATLALGSIATVSLTGTVNKNGSNYSLSDLTGTAAITVGSFSLTGNFKLTATQITVSTHIDLGSVASVDLSGTVNKNGSNYTLGDLTGTGMIHVGSFSLSATFKLTPTQITVSTHIDLGSVASVDLSGTVNKNGSNYTLGDLTGTGMIHVGSFSLSATFKLTPTQITVSTHIDLGSVASVDLSGRVNKNGSNYTLSDLTGTATITVGGFSLSGNFKLTPTQITVSTTLALGSVASVDLSGTVNKNGSNYTLSDLTGTATITVGGFSLSGNFKLTPTQITVSTTLALGSIATVTLAGTVNKNGSNYSLSDLTGTAAITVGSFSLNGNFKLTATQITVGVHLDLGSVASVDLSGTVNKNGSNYTLGDLTGTGMVHVGSFTLTATFKLTPTQITASTHIDLGSVASVDLSGTVNKNGSNYTLGDLTGTGMIHVGSFTLTATFKLTPTQITVSTHIDLGSVASVDLSGTVNKNGSNYTLGDLTGTATIHVGSFTLSGNFKLTPTQITVSTTVSIGSSLTVTLSGTVNKNGSNYSLDNLSGMAHIVILGFGLDANFTLTPTNLTVSTSFTLPVVGHVDLSGTVDRSGNYSLTASVSDIHILFFTLTSASVTLTNTSLTVAAHASHLPLVGDVDFKGTIQGSNITFTVTLPDVAILGFHLKNLVVTLTSSSLSVATHVTGLPVVGDVDFSGTIQSGGFSLTASKSNVTLLGFIHFNQVALTLNSSSLTLSADTTLPIVGAVTFAGSILFSGGFEISATAKHFTILGFIGIDNAKVALSFPNIKLTVSAHISLLSIGMVDFSGSIGAGGTFSFDGSASLVVAGFTLGKASMHMGNMPGDPSDGIHIGPFTTPALPLVGPVTLEGSYASGGRFSFKATIHPNPPIFIGPIPVDTITFGLSNDSLTLGIGVGYNLAGILNLTGYGEVTVYAASSQHNWGDFQLLASVDVSVLGFSAAHAQMVLKNTKGQFSFTLDMNLNLIIATANMHAEIDFNKGLVGFAGRANIGVAGFTLSNSTFLITNAKVQGDDVNGWTFPHDAQGHLISGGGIHIEVHSHTHLNLQPVIDANVDFDGVFQKQGSGYYISIHGKANLAIAGFTIASATLDVDNTHIAVSFHYAYPAIFSIDFAGSISWKGGKWDFDFTGHGTIGLAGFGASGMVHIYYLGSQGGKAGIDLSAHINVIVAQVDFSGYLHSNGQFQLMGSANVGLAGFSVASASFTLNNGGVTFATRINVIVAQVNFSGYVHTNGQFQLTGSANVGLAGFSVASASFTLNNGGVTFTTHINVIVAQVNFSGYVHSNGQFQLTGSANVGLAGFSVASASFTINNGGVTFATRINVIVAQVDFSGYVHSNGQFQLTGSANIGLLGFSLARASFTINNGGVSFSTSINVIVATVNFSGYVRSNGQFQLTGSARLGFSWFGATASFVLNNGGVTINASASLPVIGGINLAGYVHSNGAWQLSFSGHFGVLGFGVNGHVTVGSSGIDIGAQLDISVLGIRATFNGHIGTNGSFSFSASAGFNWGIAYASASFTLSNSGFQVELKAGVNIGWHGHLGFWDVGIGAFAAIDAKFGVDNHGNFNLDTHLGIQVCFVGCFGFSLHFHVTNHEFRVYTSEIGGCISFPILGNLCVHPFGDVVIRY